VVGTFKGVRGVSQPTLVNTCLDIYRQIGRSWLHTKPVQIAPGHEGRQEYDKTVESGFVNPSTVVDIGALAHALKERCLGGAAIDIFPGTA